MAVGLVASPMGARVQASDQHDDYPESEGWTYVNDTIAFKAGELCNKKTVLHYYGHERTLVKEGGEYVPVTDPSFLPDPGDQVEGESADSQLRLKAVRSGRKVHRVVDGEFYGKVSRDADDVFIVGVGANAFWGLGVKGLVFAEGLQSFVAEDAFTPQKSRTQNLQIVRGQSQELCYRVGLRPVHPDKNVG